MPCPKLMIAVFQDDSGAFLQADNFLLLGTETFIQEISDRDRCSKKSCNFGCV